MRDNPRPSQAFPRALSRVMAWLNSERAFANWPRAARTKPLTVSAWALRGLRRKAWSRASRASRVCAKLNSNSATRAHAKPNFGERSTASRAKRKASESRKDDCAWYELARSNDDEPEMAFVLAGWSFTAAMSVRSAAIDAADRDSS